MSDFLIEESTLELDLVTILLILSSKYKKDLFTPNIDIFTKLLLKEVSDNKLTNTIYKKLLERDFELTSENIKYYFSDSIFSEENVSKIIEQYENTQRILESTPNVILSAIKSKLSLILNKKLSKVTSLSESEIYYSLANKISDLDITSNSLDLITASVFNIIDIVKTSKNKFESSLVSMTRNSGYLAESMIVMSASPGSGKSLLCLQELIELAKNNRMSIYNMLGDLTPSKVLARLVSNILLVSHNLISDSEFSLVLGVFLNDLRAATYLDNILFSYLEQNEITAKKLLSSILETKLANNLRAYDMASMIIVDYDDNLASNIDSLYSKSGDIYKTLYKLVDDKHSVIMVSQLKVGAWLDTSEIKLHDLDNSSQKQKVIDLMMGLTLKKISPTVYYGTLSIPKDRAGLKDGFLIARNTTGHLYSIKSDFMRLIKLTGLFGFYDSIASEYINSVKAVGSLLDNDSVFDGFILLFDKTQIATVVTDKEKANNNKANKSNEAGKSK